MSKNQVTKYTGGQWIAKGAIVASGLEPDGEYAHKFCAPSAADARLIAAAPELAEALRAMFEHYENGTTSPILDAARAALAKAGV
jgi:hypothetical protein